MPDPLLVATDAGVSTVMCVRCGKPTNTVSRVCMNCLGESYRAEQVLHIAEALATFPKTKIELGHDRRRVRHMVSFDCPARAWCGVEITEARSRRTRVDVGQFPAGLCAECLGIFDRVTNMTRSLEKKS